MQVWALIVDSFRDAIDRKIFWIMTVISTLIAASMACITFTDTGFDLMFGTWTIESPGWAAGSETGRAFVGALVTQLIAGQYLCWVGIILALVATASTYPALMESGAVEVLMSKPMSRYKVFLGKYLGALVFVFLQAVIFVVLTFLVIGTRWHYWLFGYLWLIPLVVVLFSYVFSLSALFGVLTRSTVTTLMLTMLVWIGFFWVPQTAYGVFTSKEAQLDPTGRWQRLFGAVVWVVPKTQDIPVIAGKLVGAGLVSDVVLGGEFVPDEDREELERARHIERDETEKLDAFQSIGSSLLSEAVIVMLAMWQFKRRDF